MPGLKIGHVREVEAGQARIEQLRKYYAEQARWTRQTRSYLYRRVNLFRAERVLEVGCGTGEITAELVERTRASVTAVDLDRRAVDVTSERCPGVQVLPGDGRRLDFPDDCFDVALCHFTLMWCNDPSAVIAEMARVVKSSGYVLAMAEPDYGGLIEYPDSTGRGLLIEEGLRKQGADPRMGRKLRSLFADALPRCEMGLASSPWGADELEAAFDAHLWLIRDTVGNEERERIQAAHESATWKEDMMFFLPVFWACGSKK